jgi:hypothetical protein
LHANSASCGVTPSTPSEWHSLIRDRLSLSKYLGRRLFHVLRWNWANHAAKLIVITHMRRRGRGPPPTAPPTGRVSVERIASQGWLDSLYRTYLFFLFPQLSAIQKILSSSMSGPDSINAWWAKTPESRETGVRGSREMLGAQGANLKQEHTGSNRLHHHASPSIKPSRSKSHE